MTKKKLWTAEYRAWGADKTYHRYFASKAARDEFVKNVDYSNKAGTITVPAEKFDELVNH